MDDIGTGLLLNLVFWIVSVSALVFAEVLGRSGNLPRLASRIHTVQKSCRVPDCPEGAPQSSGAPKESEEPPYRKAF